MSRFSRGCVRMAPYSVELDRRVRKKDLTRLPKTELARAVKAIGGLAYEPRPAGVEKLTAQPGYRVRRGSYRILYTIDDRRRTVIVRKVAHRREAYR